MAGNIHLFKITETLTSEDVKLTRNRIWDIMEIERMTLHGNKINLSKSVTIKLEETQQSINSFLPQHKIIINIPCHNMV